MSHNCLDNIELMPLDFAQRLALIVAGALEAHSDDDATDLRTAHAKSVLRTLPQQCQRRNEQ